MARGYPDYQSSREPSIAYQTVWMDDFEAPGLKWLRGIAGGGTLPVLSVAQSWKGLQSAYLVVGAAAADISRILKYFPLLSLGRIGIELFTFLSNVAGAYLRLYLVIYDGTNISAAELHLDQNARTATIITPAGPIVVATFAFPLVAFNMFVPVKLVVDMNTDRYVSLLIGPDAVDLSTHLLVAGPASNQKLLEVNIELVGAAPGGSTAYVDDFILSQNEP